MLKPKFIFVKLRLKDWNNFSNTLSHSHDFWDHRKIT